MIDTPEYRLKRLKPSESQYIIHKRVQSVDDYFLEDVESRMGLEHMENQFEEVKQNLIHRAYEDDVDNKEVRFCKSTLKGRHKITFKQPPSQEFNLADLIKSDVYQTKKQNIEDHTNTLRILKDRNLKKILDGSLFLNMNEKEGNSMIT